MKYYVAVGGRTVEVEGTTFETIPERLFLRAALIAASELLDLTPEARSQSRAMVGAAHP